MPAPPQRISSWFGGKSSWTSHTQPSPPQRGQVIAAGILLALWLLAPGPTRTSVQRPQYDHRTVTVVHGPQVLRLNRHTMRGECGRLRRFAADLAQASLEFLLPIGRMRARGATADHYSRANGLATRGQWSISVQTTWRLSYPSDRSIDLFSE
jgi:hypothetical protein